MWQAATAQGPRSAGTCHSTLAVRACQTCKHTALKAIMKKLPVLFLTVNVFPSLKTLLYMEMDFLRIHCATNIQLFIITRLGQNKIDWKKNHPQVRQKAQILSLRVPSATKADYSFSSDEAGAILKKTCAHKRIVPSILIFSSFCVSFCYCPCEWIHQ